MAVRAGLRVPGSPAGSAEGITILTPVSLAADVAAVTSWGSWASRCLAAVAAGMILVNLAFFGLPLLALAASPTRPACSPAC